MMKDRARLLSRLEWGFALAITVFSVVLHGRWQQHAGGLWRDEVGSVSFATMPHIGEIWRNLAYDNFPPLTLIPLRLWSVFGDTDAGWRWFGLLMGLAVLAGLWLVGRMSGARTPLLALSLIALSPLAVRTTDSIRPYGFGILLACLVLGFFWRLAQTPNQRNALFASITAILAVQCLYSNAAFVLAAACAAMVLSYRRENRYGVMAALLAGVAAALSLVIHAAHLSAGRKWGIVALPVEPTTLSYMIVVGWRALMEQGSVAAVAMTAAIPALYLWRGVEEIIHSGSRYRHRNAERGRWRATSDSGWFAGTALLIGIGGYAALLLKAGLPTQPWYYVILIAFISLCLDASVGGSQPARWCRLAVAALVGLFAIAPAWSGTAIRQTNVDLGARHIDKQADKNDFILIYPWYQGITWQRYYHGPTPWMTVPPLSDLRIHRYDLLKVEMARTNQSAVMQPVMEQIRTTLQSGHRVWIVGPLPSPNQNSLLPPAPQSEFGWAGEAYDSAWGAQAAELLRDHATRVEDIPLSPTNINRFENAKLSVINGWRLSLP